MTLIEKIEADFTQALKTKDEGVLSTLRLLKSVLKNEEIASRSAGVAQPLGDEAVIKTLKTEIKKRKESAAEYQKGNRPDLADKEENEIKIIEKYLPAQLSAEEITAKIETLLSQIPEADKNNFGQVMGVVMKSIGSAADGNLVRQILQEKLAQQ